MAEKADKEPVSPDVYANKTLYLDYLVNKHKREVDAVLNLPVEQQKEFFSHYGIDPDKIMEKYPDLIARNEYLKEENISKTRTAGLLSGGAYAASLLALLLTPIRIFNNSTLLKGFFAFSGSVAAGVTAYWGATTLFTHGNRKESRAISAEARDELRYNLAVVFELVEQGRLVPVENKLGNAPTNNDATTAKEGTFASKVSSARPIAPADGHVAAVTGSDKAGAQQAL